MAWSPADDQRVLLRASKLLHHVLARQSLPHRPERFLVHQAHRTPARGVLRATAAVVRPFARTRVSRTAGVQRAVRASDDVHEVHAPIVEPQESARLTTEQIPAVSFEVQKQGHLENRPLAGTSRPDRRAVTRRYFGRNILGRFAAGTRDGVTIAGWTSSSSARIPTILKSGSARPLPFTLPPAIRSACAI